MRQVFYTRVLEMCVREVEKLGGNMCTDLQAIWRPGNLNHCSIALREVVLMSQPATFKRFITVHAAACTSLAYGRTAMANLVQEHYQPCVVWAFSGGTHGPFLCLSSFFCHTPEWDLCAADSGANIPLVSITRAAEQQSHLASGQTVPQ